MPQQDYSPKPEKPNGKSHVGASLLIVLLALFLVVSTATTFFVAVRMRTEAVANGIRVVEVTAQSYEQNLSQSLVLLDTTLSALVMRLGENGAFDYNASRLSSYLSDTVYFTPQLSSLSLLDHTGRVVASTNLFQIDAVLPLSEFKAPDNREQIHFSRPWSGSDFVSGRPISAQQPSPDGAPIMIPVSRTVKFKTKEYLLLGTVDTDFFVGSNQRIADKAGQIGIWHRNGMLLMSSLPNNKYIGIPSKDEDIRSALEKNDPSALEINGTHEGDLIVAVAPSEYAQLAVVTFLKKEHVLEIPEREARRFVLLALGSIVLISLLAAAIYLRERRSAREQQWAKEQELLRQSDLLNALPAAVAMIGVQGEVALPNAGWRVLSKKWRPTLEGKVQWPQSEDGQEQKNFIPKDLLHHLEPVLQGRQEGLESELPYTTADGKQHWFAIALRSLKSLQEMGSVMMITDITERREAEAQARLAKEVLENSTEGVIVTDPQHAIISSNPAAERITGFSADEMRGQTLAHFSSDDQGTEFFQALWKSLASTGNWQGELVNRRKNGRIYSLWLTLSAIRDNDGQIVNYAGIFTDISERKATEERIRHLSEHDPLTNLPNRILFQGLLAQAIARAQRNGIGFSLLFIDLDRFKTINDTLGHVVGDRLLQAVAERIQTCLRSVDALCRQGGDEFLVLLDGVDQPNAAAHAAEKILEQVSQPYQVDIHELRITPSIGIALYPKDGADPTNLIKSADMAMYKSKDRGRNTYHFHTQEMDSQAVEMLSLERGLRHALERDELMLHYQPLVDIASGKIMGAEALMRWNSRELGAVSPVRFIPVAENTGLIVSLGLWALKQACTQAQYWRGIGFPDFKIAVNVSAIQMEQSSFLQSVQDVLGETGFPPHLLELEVTESLLVDLSVHDSNLFEQLRQLGISLAIDDFGTGYSSLAYLRRLPLDKLKIDKSFVRDIADDPEDASIIKAIIGMARSLDLLVLAEGVETEAQLAFLREHGCDHMQGYLFSRPLAPQAFEALLRRSKALEPADALNGAALA